MTRLILVAVLLGLLGCEEKKAEHPNSERVKLPNPEELAANQIAPPEPEVQEPKKEKVKKAPRRYTKAACDRILSQFRMCGFRCSRGNFHFDRTSRCVNKCWGYLHTRRHRTCLHKWGPGF